MRCPALHGHILAGPLPLSSRCVVVAPRQGGHGVQSVHVGSCWHGSVVVLHVGCVWSWLASISMCVKNVRASFCPPLLYVRCPACPVGCRFWQLGGVVSKKAPGTSWEQAVPRAPPQSPSLKIGAGRPCTRAPQHLGTPPVQVAKISPKSGSPVSWRILGYGHARACG